MYVALFLDLQKKCWGALCSADVQPFDHQSVCWYIAFAMCRKCLVKRALLLIIFSSSFVEQVLTSYINHCRKFTHNRTCCHEGMQEEASSALLLPSPRKRSLLWDVTKKGKTLLLMLCVCGTLCALENKCLGLGHYFCSSVQPLWPSFRNVCLFVCSVHLHSACVMSYGQLWLNPLHQNHNSLCIVVRMWNNTYISLLKRHRLCGYVLYGFRPSLSPFMFT